MKKEIWKDVPDYEGLYQVSNKGRIKSLKRVIKTLNNKGLRTINERIIKLRNGNVGYPVVLLHNEKKVKMHYVHRLVMSAFYGKNSLWVDHLNMIKTDNRLENLEYVTARENIIRYSLTEKKSSKYVGVCFRKKYNTWQASIRINGKLLCLGSFKNEIDAHNAYQEKLKSLC